MADPAEVQAVALVVARTEVPVTEAAQEATSPAEAEAVRAAVVEAPAAEAAAVVQAKAPAEVQAPVEAAVAAEALSQAAEQVLSAPIPVRLRADGLRIPLVGSTSIITESTQSDMKPEARTAKRQSI